MYFDGNDTLIYNSVDSLCLTAVTELARVTPQCWAVSVLISIGWFSTFTECCCLDTNVIQIFSGTARLICIDHDTENTVMMGSQWYCRHEGQARLHAVLKVPWLVVITVASQRIKQWSDGLCTDCDQFWTHFCHIVLKVMILTVVSSTTTLFSFLLVDICFLSDLVMHPWSKIICL